MKRRYYENGRTVVEIIPDPLRVLSEKEIWFRKGRKAFLDGEPKPADRWTDQEWCLPCNREQCFFLGWMFERAIQLMEQQRVRDYIEQGIDLP